MISASLEGPDPVAGWWAVSLTDSCRDVLNRHAQKHAPLAERDLKPSMLPNEARQDYEELERDTSATERQAKRKLRPSAKDIDSTKSILRSSPAHLFPPSESWDRSAETLTPSTETVQQAYSEGMTTANNDIDASMFEAAADAMDASFLDGLDFDLTDADDPLWNAPDFAAFNVAFPTSWIPISSQPPQSTYGANLQHIPQDDIPDERFDRVREYWPSVKTDAVNSRRIWDQVVAHPEDNIFSQPGSSTVNPSLGASSTDSKWNFGEACRLRLMETLGVPSGSQNPKFPSASTLDFSLDLFFVQFHKFVPCIHVATFDASKTPSNLLLALCMVGNAMMKSPAGNQFVERHMAVRSRFCRASYFLMFHIWAHADVVLLHQNLIGLCRRELKSIDAQTAAAPLLTALASSYLTMILALIIVSPFGDTLYGRY